MWPELPSSYTSGAWPQIHRFVKQRFKYHVEIRLSRSETFQDVEAWLVDQFGVRVIAAAPPDTPFWTVGVWHHLETEIGPNERFVGAFFLIPEHALAFKMRWQ